MSDTYPGKNEELYNKYLMDISGVKFTSREVDILSCLYHNRGEKKIGSLLNISYRTVGAHVRNIMAKLGNSSRDYVIDFIEKSGKLNHLKEYYLNLIVEGAFKKQLQNIKSQNRTSIEVILPKSNQLQENEHILLEKIKEYLLIANIKSIDSKKENEESESIILLYEEGGFDEKKSNLKEIKFSLNEILADNFYFSILNLVAQIVNKPSIEELNKEFEKEYNSLHQSFVNNKGSIEEKPSKPRNSKILKPAIVSFIVIILSICAFSYISSNPYETQDKYAQSESWNLPLELEHYIDRTKIVEEIWDRLKNSQEERTSVSLVGLHGLGGIGKTTIANNIIHHPQKPYNFRAWFSAENKELLESDYFDLGSKHSLFNQEMSSKQKILAVKEWLQKQDKILLIYDNVPDIDSIKNYLPNKGDIIITSRNYLLPGAVEIDVMSKKESIKLLSSLLPKHIRKKADYKDKAAILANKLGYLPLALSQAGSYIKYNKLSIDEYLSLYERQQRKLLSDNTMPAMDNHLPAYVTWDMSIKQLSKVKGGEDAIKILDAIAYCYPENIPKKFLAQILYKKSDSEGLYKINKTLSLLRSYSLLKISEDSVSIHRLIHSWAKDNHTKEQTKKILLKHVKSIKAHYPRVEEKWQEIKTVQSILPHIEFLLPAIRKNLGDNEYADMIAILGDIYYTVFIDSKAEEFLQEALKIKKEKFGSDHIEIAEILHTLGKSYRGIGEYKKSMEYLSKALAIREKHYGRNHLKTSYTIQQLGVTYRRLGAHYKSQKALEEALEIKKHILPENDLGIAYALHHLGKTYRRLNEYDKSLESLNKAFNMKEKQLGRRHLETSYTLYQLGKTHLRLGNYDKGLKFLSEDLENRTKHLGRNHIETSITIHQLGKVYRKMEEYDKSLALLEEALQIKEKYLGRNNVEVASTLHQLGVVHNKLKNYDLGIEYLQEALSIKIKTIGENHAQTAFSVHQLGVAYTALGDYKKSKEYLEKDLKIKRNFFGENHVQISFSYYRLGFLHFKLKNYGESISYLEKALEIQTKHFGSQHISLQRILTQLKQSYKLAGEDKKSKQVDERLKLINIKEK